MKNNSGSVESTGFSPNENLPLTCRQRFVCRYCRNTFDSGQALGGHQHAHPRRIRRRRRKRAPNANQADENRPIVRRSRDRTNKAWPVVLAPSNLVHDQPLAMGSGPPRVGGTGLNHGPAPGAQGSMTGRGDAHLWIEFLDRNGAHFHPMPAHQESAPYLKVAFFDVWAAPLENLGGVEPLRNSSERLDASSKEEELDLELKLRL